MSSIPHSDGIKLVWGKVFQIGAGLGVENLVDQSRELGGVAPDNGQHLCRLVACLTHIGRVGQPVERTLNQRKGRAQLMAHLGVEIELGVGHLLALLGYFGPLQVIHVDDDEHDEQQGHDANGKEREQTLVAEFLQITIGHVVELVDIGRLAHDFLILHEQHIGIVARDEGRHQLHLLFVGLAVKNVYGELQQLVATGGIDIGGVENGVAHQLYAPVLTSQTVDAAEHRQGGLLATLLDKSPAHAHGHAVVLAKDEVDG